jgi:uncharacterized protein (TIGR00645 family)
MTTSNRDAPSNLPEASPPPPPHTPDRCGPTRRLDWAVFEVRWLLYPINAGLTVALFVYLLRFLWQVGAMVAHIPALVMAPSGEDHQLLVIMVSLLDQAMISSLLILTIMGGHQIYVRRFQDHLAEKGPYWLKRIDTIVLKVKLGLAFTGVSSVVILKDCISIDVVPTAVWVQHVIIHAVFQPELFTEPVWGKGKTQEIGMNTVKRRSWQIDHL